ncbi:unnamed protein product [Leptidea sinapis]|uniref:Dynein heavy chain 2, axonemal n=1 Tax=Leptidea sinapis TaxID=189913 RepID=A0A5E4QS82_9NEOP|nr:unnamed protein product [Leptidea sinapis]
MLTEEELSNCRFVPESSMKRAIKLLTDPSLSEKSQSGPKECRLSLLDLQKNKTVYNSKIKISKWKSHYHHLVCKAIYSHNWDQLLYLLKKSPPNESSRASDKYIYTRALTILLMFHPVAKSKCLLNDYFHMVLSCRSEQDKKALCKVLLTLPNKIVQRTDYNAIGLPVAKAMMSEDGECIEWRYNLVLDGPAEVWLNGLESTMRIVLRDQMILTRAALRKCKYQREQWINDWPGQLGITCSKLKFYWDREREDCFIRQTNTNSVYTYEYIGNSGRLVITPLTDRCYITLTTALNLFRGGSPQGPAGTGKTETTKDLGRALARWVVVTNCSDGLDYKSMAKCFAGIAQSGCWGCFDEFNRINIEVLSVVAQQILAVLLALSQTLKRFMFEGADIKLDGNCGIFITMNPGYAGRTELPDNLKSMFRPIAMCVFTLYQLAMQQLSKQEHYDFGLRSMVALLRYAGIKRRAYPHLPEQEDVPLFDGIMQDIFPDVTVPTLDYDLLETAITAEMKIAGLQPVKAALHKVIQTFETKNSRHSSILLGDTNTAKTVSWKMLAATLSRLRREKVPGFENVQVYPMNPKALTLGELYGEYNLGTGEWKDGVLSSIMRTTCQDESPDMKWIIFDGPVDAIWIENLNSVMDDNKLLTLVNSERISMPSQVSLLIETLDLAVASPATVSRNGMVYNDYRDWGWWPFVNSWLDTIDDPEYKEMLRRHFLNILTPVLELKRLHLTEGQSVRGQELTGVRSMCRLLGLLPPPAPPGPDEEDNENFSKMRFLFAYSTQVINMSAQTTAANVQDIIEARLEKRTKGNYDMVLCAAAGPPGGARSPLPPRLLSCFHSFFLPPPTQQQLVKIFGKIVLIATIDMFNNIVAKLLPTPSKMHYQFNLRDISKIFQGLLRSNKDYQNTKPRFLRLWICESFRVFSDRLTEEKDREWFMGQMGDMLGKHFELTFHALCPTKSAPIFGHFLNPYEVYDDLNDPNALRRYIANQMEEYNSCPGVVKMDLVLFKDAIEHIVRIVVCTKTYGVKDFREDLKVLYTNCGVDCKKTTFIFCDTQIVEETFTEIINNLLSSGEIKQALEKPMKAANIMQTAESVYLFLVDRVRANMHIVLCFSPIGDDYRNRIRQYPALINATTTNWFLEWPREALLEVAYKMLKAKRIEIALQANKLRNGLGKVEETTKLVQVAEYTEQCIEYMGVINVQQRNADEQQRSVAARSKKTQEEEVQCKKLAEAAMRDLASAMPALEEAVKALDALNKKDITEVKSYAKPPQKVEMVLEAVLILLQKEPTWAEAKRQLGDQYFLDRLRDFDKDNIADKTLKKIGTYTAKPDFDPEIVGTVSLAAKSLCLWVRAIEKYGKVYKIVKPKKERLEEALESLRMKQQILAEARAKLRELSEMIARLQKEYDEKVAQKEELERKSRMLQLKLERAEALITGLSGDCLIATGFVAYLGPFVSEYREYLMDDWFRETTMVNFAVKEQGLTSQLLGIVVRKERPQLELMKDNLVMTIANNKKTLVDLENDLLRIMYESQVPLLENEELFITLQTSQRTSLQVKEALITSQVTEKEIDTARQGYVPVAVRASVLFFALNDLSRIDPMYQFSLDAYIDLFTYSIDRSPKGGELEDRINNLNEFHTFAEHLPRAVRAPQAAAVVPHGLPDPVPDGQVEHERVPFPPQGGSGEWNDVCNEFQRILFVRSLRADRIAACVSTFIINTLGPRYVEPPVLDIRAAWEESTWKTSLLFVLSPGVDPTSSLIQLALDGLKGNLVRIFSNLNENKFDEATPMYRRLLFCVSFFHCSLIARKRFRQLGYNAVYSFNDADFDVSDNLLANYLEEYDEVPWDALRYLFAIINYGGHITDDWDKRDALIMCSTLFALASTGGGGAGGGEDQKEPLPMQLVFPMTPIHFKPIRATGRRMRSESHV